MYRVRSTRIAAPARQRLAYCDLRGSLSRSAQQMVSSNMWNWVTGPDGAMVCVPNHGRQQEWNKVERSPALRASHRVVIN
jgi:hypothetical protein